MKIVGFNTQSSCCCRLGDEVQGIIFVIEVPRCWSRWFRDHTLRTTALQNHIPTHCQFLIPILFIIAMHEVPPDSSRLYYENQRKILFGNGIITKKYTILYIFPTVVACIIFLPNGFEKNLINFQALLVPSMCGDFSTYTHLMITLSQCSFSALTI